MNQAWREAAESDEAWLSQVQLLPPWHHERCCGARDVCRRRARFFANCRAGEATLHSVRIGRRFNVSAGSRLAYVAGEWDLGVVAWDWARGGADPVSFRAVPCAQEAAGRNAFHAIDDLLAVAAESAVRLLHYDEDADDGSEAEHHVLFEWPVVSRNVWIARAPLTVLAGTRDRICGLPAEPGAPIFRLSHDGVDFVCGEHGFVLSGGGGVLRLWDTKCASSRMCWEMEWVCPRKGLRPVAFSFPRACALTGWDEELSCPVAKVWDIDGKLAQKLKLGSGTTYCVAMEFPFLFATNSDGELGIFDLSSADAVLEPVAVLRDCKENNFISARGGIVVGQGRHGCLNVWNFR